MAEGLDRVYKTIDEQNSDQSAHTRRKLVSGAAAALGGMGLLSLPGVASAAGPVLTKDTFSKNNTPENILAVAATAEVLATIVNTVGAEKHLGRDAVTQRNIRAAAREEKIHFVELRKLGGREITRKIWIPDSVFANRTNFLSTLEVGDQIFVNAYLIGVVAFGFAGMGQEAALSAEIMGVEAVHRALARQSLGKLGNDRVFMKADRRETAPDAPNRGQAGFSDIFGAVEQLKAAGFGFGEKGKGRGRFYHFDEVSKRTPRDPDLNTTQPDLLNG